MPQDQRRGLQRLEQLGELNRQHRLGVRQRDQVDLRLEHDAERAFRSDHQLRQIERPVGADELVEVVAANTAQHFGKPAIDLTGVLPREAPDHCDSSPLQDPPRRTSPRPPSCERSLKRATEPSDEHHLLLEHVIDRLAVEHRARTARIVGHHAADRGAAGGRDVGCESQSVRLELRRSARRARFPARPAPSAPRRSAPARG